MEMVAQGVEARPLQLNDRRLAVRVRPNDLFEDPQIVAAGLHTVMALNGDRGVESEADSGDDLRTGHAPLLDLRQQQTYRFGAGSRLIDAVKLDAQQFFDGHAFLYAAARKLVAAAHNLA